MVAAPKEENKMTINMSMDAVAEKRLLSAVVAHAVRDACHAPIMKGTKKKVASRMKPETVSAMAFLFDTSRSGLDAYAIWLDFDADQFRQKLIDVCFKERVPSALHLTDDQRRCFRINYKLFKTSPVQPLPDDEMDEDENV